MFCNLTLVISSGQCLSVIKHSSKRQANKTRRSRTKMTGEKPSRGSLFTAHHFFTLLNFVIVLLITAWAIYNVHYLREEIEFLKSNIRDSLKEDKKTASQPFEDFVAKSRKIRQMEGGHGMMSATPDGAGGSQNVTQTLAPDDGGGGSHEMMTMAPKAGEGGHGMMTTAQGDGGGSHGMTTASPQGGGHNMMTENPQTGQQNVLQSTAQAPHGGMGGMGQATGSPYGEMGPQVNQGHVAVTSKKINQTIQQYLEAYAREHFGKYCQPLDICSILKFISCFSKSSNHVEISVSSVFLSSEKCRLEALFNLLPDTLPISRDHKRSIIHMLSPNRVIPKSPTHPSTPPSLNKKI